MTKKISLLFGLLFILSTANAQQSNISGSLTDTSTKQSLQHAVVALLRIQDSVLVDFTRADASGKYSLRNTVPGDYILWVMHPSFADFVDQVKIESLQQRIPAISVTPKSKLLEAVIIKSGNPIRVKGDTTIYTADSFKVSANANVEELLKKLPGIQVDKNGQITAMGETVKKVLVDGEEFFGDDPGMAVKNLRADAIKEVQVFDKKSEQAEFTGIDDGNTQKTINLRMKEDRKKGYFGKIDVSGGLMKDIDDRYNNNIMYSNFKGKRKLSGFLLMGNTGQDGLSWEDSDKYGAENENMTIMEDGGIMIQSGGSSDGEPYVNTDNGFTKNVNLGLQYSNKWNDKTKLNFSPKYNNQIYSNMNRTFTQTRYKSDSVLNTLRNSGMDVNRSNVKLSALYDVKIDSNNTLKIIARSNFYNTESNETTIDTTKGAFNNLKNSIDKSNQSKIEKMALSGSVSYQHKFKKLRRTFSWLVDMSNIGSTGKNFLQSQNVDYSNPTPEILDVNQMIDNDKQSSKLSSRMVYTEPLTKKYSLELGYELSKINGKNDLTTYNYNDQNNKFDELIDTLSNNFDQSIVIHKPSMKISYQTKKMNFNFGSGFGITAFDLEDKSYDKNYQRNYTNIFPTANFKYNYKSNHSLNVNYYGYSTQPTIDQLQPLRNSTNQFYQVLGNPDLKPSFTHSFRVSHNAYNFLKELWMYQSLNLNMSNQAIINKRTINLDNGETISQPVNTDGNYSISFWSGLGIKLKKADIRLGFNPNFNFRKSTQIINEIMSHTENLNMGISFNISKSKAKKYDFSLSNNFSTNRSNNVENNNNVQSEKLNKFNTYNGGFYANVYYKKVWLLRSDFEWNVRESNQQDNSSLNSTLWNASLEKTFKKDEFTIYLKVRDILNQNIGITQNYSGDTYTESENQRLKRYFLLGFKWDFMNKAAKTK